MSAADDAKWQQRKKDVEVVRQAMQDIAQDRVWRGTVFVPPEDADRLLVKMQRAGLYNTHLRIAVQAVLDLWNPTVQGEVPPALNASLASLEAVLDGASYPVLPAEEAHG